MYNVVTVVDNMVFVQFKFAKKVELKDSHPKRKKRDKCELMNELTSGGGILSQCIIKFQINTL